MKSMINLIVMILAITESVVASCYRMQSGHAPFVACKSAQCFVSQAPYVRFTKGELWYWLEMREEFTALAR